LQAIGGFPRDLGPAADYAVYLRLARTDRVGAVPRERVRSRQHDASMSRDPALMLRATLAALRREQRDAPAWAQAPLREGLGAGRGGAREHIIRAPRAHVRRQSARA